jgi:hypothetical protein
VFVVQEKLSLSEQTKLCSLLLRLLEQEKDSEIIFGLLVALGTLVSFVLFSFFIFSQFL